MEKWLVVDVHNVNNNGVVKVNFFTEIKLEAGWCFSMLLALIANFSEAVDDLFVSISSGSLENTMKACG